MHLVCPHCHDVIQDAKVAPGDANVTAAFGSSATGASSMRCSVVG